MVRNMVEVSTLESQYRIDKPKRRMKATINTENALTTLFQSP